MASVLLYEWLHKGPVRRWGAKQGGQSLQKAQLLITCRFTAPCVTNLGEMGTWRQLLQNTRWG